MFTKIYKQSVLKQKFNALTSSEVLYCTGGGQVGEVRLDQDTGGKYPWAEGEGVLQARGGAHWVSLRIVVPASSPPLQWL